MYEQHENYERYIPDVMLKKHKKHEEYLNNAYAGMTHEEIYKSKLGTVGTLMNAKHLSPTPVGLEVTCRAELTEVDGRRLVFKVTAEDARGPIGEGTHERAIIQNERFVTKAYKKLEG